MPTIFLPFSFGPSVVSAGEPWTPVAGPTTVTWGAVGSQAVTWNSASTNTADRWADLTPSTYTSYTIGENFVIIANEQYPMYANEDRPLIVPPDSGYST